MPTDTKTPTPTPAKPRRRVTAKKPTHVSINVALPVAVHRALRIKAIQEGIDLAEAVTAAVKAWTK